MGACRCGARRVDQQLGLEPTPDLYVQRMVEVFREVRRVLRADGTCWVNLGDSYAGSWGNQGRKDERGEQRPINGPMLQPLDGRYPQKESNTGAVPAGLKAKDLVGIPWLVARALQEPCYTGRIPRERDRVWLAATIDGEGTICGTAHTRKDDGRTRTMPQVFITNSSLAMLEEAHRIWPTSRSGHSHPGDGHLGTVDVFRWIVHGIENKTACVRELYPYLIVKRTQALLAYNLLVLMADAKRLGKSSQAQAVRDKRELLCRLMSELNHAQAVDIPSWCVEPPSLYEPGWYLRSDIIWSKPNPMPESVTDRPTKAHEYVFLLSKGPRYFFDQEAVRETTGNELSWEEWNQRRKNWVAPGTNENGILTTNAGDGKPDGGRSHPNGRNVRSVWEIATQPYPEAHFATYPEELVRRCVLAGTSERGCCPECGQPWEREVEHTPYDREDAGRTKAMQPGSRRNDGARNLGGTQRAKFLAANPPRDHGWRPGCGCGRGFPIEAAAKVAIPCTVLDPFLGSGTTAHVARKHGRRSIGIELNPAYAELAARRMQQQSLFTEAL